jgi:hypothetical protein
MQQNFPYAHLILAGDFDQLSDSELVTRTALTSVKSPPTRGRSRLDRLYVSDLKYSGIEAVKSAATNDHLKIVAYTGFVKYTVGKTWRVCTFRKHTVAQNAHFLASVSDPVHIVDVNGDPQE